MKFSISGLFKFKPFDEAEESAQTQSIYAENPLIGIGILVSFVVIAVAPVLFLLKNQNAVPCLAIGLGISAITSGLEWNAGLRARPLNHIFLILIGVCIMALAAPGV